MTEKRNLDERILGFIMGIGVGALIGFLLHEREREHPAPRAAALQR